MNEKKRKKNLYEILPTSVQLHGVRIRAFSAAEACRILQDKIGGKPVQDTAVATLLISNIWSDPGREREKWMVSAIAPGGKEVSEIMVWDGKATRNLEEARIAAKRERAKNRK